MTLLLKTLLTGASSEREMEFLLKEYRLLHAEYQLLSGELSRELKKQGKINSELETKLRNAKKLAEYLRDIYAHYLTVPREAERFREEIAIYRQLLKDDQKDDENAPMDTRSQMVRQKTARTNTLRLLLIRLKRLLRALIPLFKRFKYYGIFMQELEKYASPAIAWLAWLFFVPRLFTNLFLLGKHALPGFWMGEKEAQLRWQTRLALSFERHWFELANDVAWVLVGILNCFVLIGALTPVGVICSYALFAYDVVTALVRCHVELDRLERLRDLYVQAARDELVKALDERIAHEQKRLYLSLITATALLIAMTFTLPLFSIGIIAPIIVAASLVIITMASYLAGRYLEVRQPVEDMAHLQKQGALQRFGVFANNKTDNDSDSEEMENMVQSSDEGCYDQAIPK